VRALGFSTEMPTLLQVSSAVVARAGATTAGEALLCECPIIFNRLGGIMPQEIPTWRYFRKRRIGFAIARATELRTVIERWLEQPEQLVELRARINQARDETTPKPALDLLLSTDSLENRPKL
jgi:processive 1,2-diacylglycerol beta-glucosyltransferase